MLAQTTTRNRQDLTKTLSPDQRRLDSLAKLLAAHSECVAVFILDGKIYITANELFKGTQIENNKNYAAIKEIMSYFQKMAKSKSIKPEERENIFVKICSTARFKESSPEGISEKIAKEVLNGKGTTLTIGDIFDQYKENVTTASRIYGEFAKLSKYFLKLEQTFNSATEELQTLKNNFSQDFIILKEEDSPGIHAEVQLLAKAIKSKDFLSQNKKIYIGISKLCCLHCRCMLETANEELKKDGVEFVFRGKHDLDFSSNWSSPSIFEKGYNSVRGNPRSARDNTSASDKNALEFVIGKNSRILINELSKEIKPKGINMDPSESSSEEGDQTGARIYQQKAFLERNLQLITSMATENLVSAKELILVALSMHDSDTFFQLCKIAKSIPEDEKTSYLITIMQELNRNALKSENEINLDQIIKIMKNPNLVGDVLADAYKEYVQPENQERSKNKEHEGERSDQLTLRGHPSKKSKIQP